MATSIQAAPCLTIPENTPRVTALNPNFLSLEERPTHGDFVHDRPGYLSNRGPRHDNDHVNYRDIQILPTTDEILAVHRSPYMPKKNVGEPNFLEAGPQRLLDLLFRHLRYDSIEGIRDVGYHAAQHLVKSMDEITGDYEPRQETPAGNRYFLYSNVQFEEILSDEKRGLIVRLSYTCPQFMRGRGMIRSGRLEAGMLCALVCLEEDERHLSTTFFEVHMAQSTDSMKVRGGAGVRAAVQLAFTRPAKHDDVQRILRHAQGLSSGHFVLVEFPKLLYAGFYHCLSTLQRIQGTDMAFTDYVAPRAAALASRKDSANTLITEVSPPLYSTMANFRFNVGCLAHNHAKFALSELQTESGQKFVQFLKQKTTLDDGQSVALQNCLTREIAFTQGPPGTGKTFLGVALSRVLLASRSPNKRKPILVVCLTNHALDSFLRGLLDAGVSKIARIGRGSKEEWIKKFELHALTKNTRMSVEAWEKKTLAAKNAQTLFAEIEAGCKGFNAESSSGTLSWPTVEAYLRSTHPQVYQQLTTANDNPYTQSFTFDYWAGGGDLRNLRELRHELESCLLGNSNEDSSISTEGIDRALEQITLHAQQQSAQAQHNNIWKLSSEGRQQTLRRWKSEIDREALMKHYASLQIEHQSAEQAIRKSWHRRDAKCLLEQDIIGLTTTACASNWEMLKSLDLEVVICEEAGEVMEAHTLCSLFPTVQHAIFIGDPQQLRPGVSEQNMSLESATGSQYRLDESLFERCMFPTDPASRPMPTSQLNIQRRMHPDVADITRLVYPYLQDHPNTSSHPPTNGISERTFWIDHRMPEAEPSAASKSYTNPHEVAMVTGMVKYLIKREAYSLGDIAILTPYNGQLAALNDSMKTTCSVWLSEKDRQSLLDDGLLEEPEERKPRSKDQLNMSDLLRIATVDNFQGEEAKVVILTTVRSGARPGFLKTMNRINVACSRARDGFYIVGNAETLGRVPMWRRIIDVFASRGRIGTSLDTCCSRHPDHHTVVHTPQEFDQVQECDVACGETLSCGHVCQERCHPPELHERLPCTNPCKVLHPCGHQCQKVCSEICGPCTYPIEQQVLPCGHAVDVLCSGGLPTCTKLISTLPLPCGHSHSYRCCDKDKPYTCDEQCAKTLSCGHTCQATCADCQASHRPCSSMCGAKLQGCDHYCDSECHPGCPCPPCKQPCEESCAHGSCKNLCSDSCDPCMRPRGGDCSHQAQSSLMCSLPSDILPCCEPCDKFLPCGHPCPSFCGEVCPTKECPQCVSGTVTPALFCPTCERVLDDELDKRVISSVYDVDENGKITGFACKSPAISLPDKCLCGLPLHSIRRYSVFKQIDQAPSVFGRLVSQLGKSLVTFSRRLYFRNKELEESFPAFCSQIRPNPLAAGQNKALVASRAQCLLQLSDSIQDFNTSTAVAFERSVSWLQSSIPSALASVTNRTLQPTFSLRFAILQRRARNYWIVDCLRVSRHLAGLEDPSLEVQRMSELLRLRASRECWHGIAECEATLTKSLTAQAPAIEVETRLQQIQLNHLLDISLAAANPALKAPSMSPDAPTASLQHATTLCRRFPNSAAKFSRLVVSFDKFRREHTPPTASALPSLPPSCCNESREAELAWSDNLPAHIAICHRGGHPYRGDACPECGREVLVPVQTGDEARKARECLFEDQFLAAMRRRG